MIAYLKGTVLEKGEGSLILEAGGVGYEVCVAPSTLRRAGGPGEPLELFISETIALYGGGATLYGFLSREEKGTFLALKEHVPSTGAKKALEHLEKASRSLPDFRRAVLEGDARILATVFGFTRKTAERLIAGLKDTLGSASPTAAASPAHSVGGAGRGMQQALDALLALGYKPGESREVLGALASELDGRTAGVEELVRTALKRL